MEIEILRLVAWVLVIIIFALAWLVIRCEVSHAKYRDGMDYEVQALNSQIEFLKRKNWLIYKRMIESKKVDATHLKKAGAK